MSHAQNALLCLLGVIGILVACRYPRQPAWFVRVKEVRLWRDESLEVKSSLTKKLELKKRNDRHLFLQAAIQIIFVLQLRMIVAAKSVQVLGLTPLSIVASEIEDLLSAVISAMRPAFLKMTPFSLLLLVQLESETDKYACLGNRDFIGTSRGLDNEALTTNYVDSGLVVD
jgi:hypothetical protein